MEFGCDTRDGARVYLHHQNHPYSTNSSIQLALGLRTKFNSPTPIQLTTAPQQPNGTNIIFLQQLRLSKRCNQRRRNQHMHNPILLNRLQHPFKIKPLHQHQRLSHSHSSDHHKKFKHMKKRKWKQRHLMRFVFNFEII